MASEPLWDGDVRTRDHWATVYKDADGYHAEFGDEVGKIAHKDAGTFFDVEQHYRDWVSGYRMKEDSRKEIKEENKALTLEDIVRLYFEEGNYLDNGMDEALETFKEETGIRYHYKTLFSNSGGFLARVVISRKGEKTIVFIDYDGMTSHMVRSVD